MLCSSSCCALRSNSASSSPMSTSTRRSRTNWRRRAGRRSAATPPASRPSSSPSSPRPSRLFGDAGVALRLTQALNAVATSLAARLPARSKARSREGVALAAALLAVLVPDLFDAGLHPRGADRVPLRAGRDLRGGAHARRADAGTRWLRWRWQGSATFARIQFIVLLIAFVLAALIARTGLRRLEADLRPLRARRAPWSPPRGSRPRRAIACNFHVDPGPLLHGSGGRLDAARLRRRLAHRAGRTGRPGAARTGCRAASSADSVCFAVVSSRRCSSRPTPTARRAGVFRSATSTCAIPLLLLAFGLSLGRGGRVRGAVALIAAVLIAVVRFLLAGWVDDHGRQDLLLLMVSLTASPRAWATRTRHSRRGGRGRRRRLRRPRR